MERRIRTRAASLRAARSLTAPLVSAVAIAAAGAPAGARVLDDFETGALPQVETTSSAVYYQAISHPRHGATLIRTLFLGAYAGTAEAELALTPSNDALFVQFEPGGGQFSVAYDFPGGIDLTEGGVMSQLQMNFVHPLLSPGNLTVTMEDAAGSQSVAQPIVLGLNDVSFGSFAPVDPTNATRVQISVQSGTIPDVHWLYVLSDVRTVRPFFGWLEYDVIETLAAGPPYPTPPVEIEMTPPGGPGPVTAAGMQIASATPPEGLALTARATGESGFEEIALNFDAQSFEGASIDVLVTIDPVGGSGTGAELTQLPAIHVDEDGSGFGLTFPLVQYDRSGGVVASSTQSLNFDIVFGQPLRFADVRLTPVESARPGGEGEALRGAANSLGGFRLAFDVESSGEEVLALPLFTATWTGDWAPGVTPTAASEPWVALPAAARLTATPSVTRGATELRLARPSAFGGAIDVIDVAGRLVRSLRLAAGGSSVVWDGRTDGGSPAAAGVYFARLSARAAEDPGAAARIIRVR
jgi:hypothetical protein